MSVLKFVLIHMLDVEIFYYVNIYQEILSIQMALGLDFKAISPIIVKTFGIKSLVTLEAKSGDHRTNIYTKFHGNQTTKCWDQTTCH